MTEDANHAACGNCKHFMKALLFSPPPDWKDKWMANRSMGTCMHPENRHVANPYKAFTHLSCCPLHERGETLPIPEYIPPKPEPKRWYDFLRG